ncbi:MAG: kynA [Gemmatimonadetes bacterium]|nr:kynA [Gemmatimonadota bacterium]
MSFGREEAKLSYGGYLRVQDLLSLQEQRSSPPQHDEMLFILIHQVYELWFKQVLHEMGAILLHLERDEVLGADRLLRRCIEIQRVLIQQLTVLETMMPVDFLAFRDHLMPASGFQSAQFRELEFVAGLKDERHLRTFAPDSPEHATLSRRLAEGTLPDALFALLRRRGFDAPPALAGGGEPARADAYDRRVRALVRVYREAESNYALLRLCETLIEFDGLFTLWRFRHVQMVERVIGGKPGSGGSEGAGYLRSTLDRRAFPELWEVRSRLGAGDGYGAHSDDPGGFGDAQAHAPAKVDGGPTDGGSGDGPAPGGGCPMGY